MTVGDLRMTVKGGKQVLYYEFSSYQKSGKLWGYCGLRKVKLLVYNLLYYSKNDNARTGGKNMRYDHGVFVRLLKATVKQEFCHKAITIT